jgi:hypothetical protein
VLVLLGVFLFSFASAEIPDDCENSMIAYWQFESDLLDVIGDHDGGVWTGSENYASFAVGDALYLSGNDKVTIPNAADLDLDSAFTIEGWTKSALSPDAVLFEKGEYKIEWVSGIPFSFINVTIGDSVLTSQALSFDAISHFALVWDSSLSNLILYIDGVEVDNANLSSAANAAGNLIIGDGFKGYIDELAIYDDNLDASTIALHYSLGDSGKDYCDESGAAGSSSTKADFNIRGCNFDFGGGTLGLAKGRCSGVPADGMFYCDDDRVGWETEDPGLGCSMGDDEYDINNNNDFCCPPGEFCNETGVDTGLFKCDRRVENCFDQNDSTSCTDIGCIWLEIEETCADGTRDYSCGYYNDATSCGADEWNLSQTGIGTELCGTTIECNGEIFSIPESDCSCAWYPVAPIGQRCQVSLVGVQMFYDPATGPDKFSCSNAYNLGDCVDGEQDVNWTSTSSIISGFTAPAGIPDDCLNKLNCNGGESTRFCGEPIIKLPGFSFFALFTSLFIIGMYYFVKREDLSKVVN